MANLWSSSLGLLSVFALVLLNGFFVAAEFALVSVRKSRIEQLVNEGSRQARSVQKALGHLDTYIAATQLGITMASLALGFIGEPAIAHLLEPLFDRFLPSRGAAITSHGIAIVIAFAIATALHIVLGELAPKSIALQRPDRTALWVTAPLDLFLKVFRPFILALNATGNFIVRLLGLQPVTEHSGVHSVEELELIVHSTTEAGLLEEQQERMVAGVFDFEETIVRRLMTPRLDITAVEADVGTEELIRAINESGHSRLPVYDDNIDNIIGILHAKDILKNIPDGRLQASVREMMRPAYFIPENKRAGYLLSEFRRNKIQIAIVRDEYGTVAGVVTIEDLLEEIVGEIQDEYDVEEPMVQIIDDSTAILDGRMPLGDVNEKLKLELPEDESDTIGGFVFSLLGHQAAQGERTTWENLECVVEATDGRRITKVRLIQHPEPSDGDSAPEEGAQTEAEAPRAVLETPAEERANGAAPDEAAQRPPSRT